MGWERHMMMVVVLVVVVALLLVLMLPPMVQPLPLLVVVERVAVVLLVEVMRKSRRWVRTRTCTEGRCAGQARWRDALHRHPQCPQC